MKNYLINFTLPQLLSSDFLELIPDQRNIVSQLFNDGILRSYTMSTNREHIWATIEALDVDEAKQITKIFPLEPYMKLEIHELAFNELAIPEPMAVILN